VGETAATHAGWLALSNTTVTANNATEAVTSAFTGSISVAGAGSDTFSPSNVGSSKHYPIESSGEQFAVAMEDMASQSGSDWDYNDRVWLLLVRNVSTQSVVYTNSFPWTDPYSTSTSATVTVTVTANVPGHEGRYHWNYHVANHTFDPWPNGGLGIFSLPLSDPETVDDISSSLGWHEGFGVYGDSNVLSWYVDDYLPQIQTGGSADFSFTACGASWSSWRAAGFKRAGPPTSVSRPRPTILA
jgi:hypothetical protein